MENFENNSTESNSSYYNQPSYQSGYYSYNYSKPNSNPPTPPKKNKEGFSLKTIIIAVLVAAIVGAGTGAVTVKYLDKDTVVSEENGTVNNKVTTINVDKTASNVVEAVAEKVTDSVVGIRTTASVTNFFYGSTESTGEGSGIIYKSDGYIITNYHVISEAVESNGGKIEVFLADQTETAIPATVVGYNISTDLAVIKVEKTGLSAIELADSDDIKVGEFVVAIGNPGGLEYISTVTYGIVSGLNRSLSGNDESEINYIQTDAAINPGNSGGALVNTEGKLIGVNSVKIVSESYEGMGFAIPTNTVIEVCQNIIDHKDDPVPYIGITLSERYDASTLRYLGFPSGAVVQSVADGSPADEVHIKRGDIITELDGKEINDYNDFEDALNSCKVGASVKIKIYRSGDYYTSSITIESDNSAK